MTSVLEAESSASQAAPAWRCAGCPEPIGAMSNFRSADCALAAAVPMSKQSRSALQPCLTLQKRALMSDLLAPFADLAVPCDE